MTGDDDEDIEQAARYASALHPAIDAWPSSAIDFASFNGSEISISFKNGESYIYPCSISEWISYKTSPSRGSAYHRLFKHKGA